MRVRVRSKRDREKERDRETGRERERERKLGANAPVSSTSSTSVPHVDVRVDFPPKLRCEKEPCTRPLTTSAEASSPVGITVPELNGVSVTTGDGPLLIGTNRTKVKWFTGEVQYC